MAMTENFSRATVEAQGREADYSPVDGGAFALFRSPKA